MAEIDGDYERVTDHKLQIILMFLVFAVTLLDGMNLSIVNIALPEIASDIGMSASNGSWILNAYNLGIAAPLLAFIKIADTGRVRGFFVSGVAVFSIASFFCGISDSYIMLCASRFVAGIGASMMGATAPIIVIRMLPENMKGRGMAMLSMSMGVSFAIGPLLGGFLMSIASWKWIFLINVPFGLLTIVLGYMFIPKVSRYVTFQSPDIPSIIYTGLSVSLILIVMENFVHTALPRELIVACAIGAVVSLLLLLRRMRMRKIKNQLIHLSMLINWEFIFVAGVFFITTAVAAGFLYILPFFLQIPWEMSEMTCGLFISLISALSIAISLYTGKWCDTKGCKTPVALAVFTRVAFCSIFVFMVPSWGIVPLIIALLIAGLSFGISTVAQNTRILQHTTPEYQAEASAIMLQIHYISSSFGVVLYAFIISLITGNSTDLSPSMATESMHITSIIGAALCIVALVMTLAVKNIIPGKEKQMDGADIQE